MSKKMKVWTAGVLGIMMAGLVCVNVYALDDKDVIGTWYANSLTMDGLSVFHPGAIMMEMTLEINEGGKATLVTIEDGTETTAELEGELDQNALVLKSTEEKTEDEEEDYSLFSTETMRLYLLDDGKLCFTTADSLDEAADAEDSEESMDWTIKVFFDKLEVK